MATYRYFSANRVAPRYGTGAFIGAIRTKSGFVVNSEEIVPVSSLEIRANLKAYNHMLKPTVRRSPILKERTREEYVEYAKKIGFDPVKDDKYPIVEPANPKNKRTRATKADLQEFNEGDEK